MKERIVITDEKFVRQARNTILVGYPLEFEQVPETWEELVELCKHYEDVEIWNGIIRINREDRGNIEIYSLDGTIACNEYLLAEDRTISQMWEIIRNLMEE